MSIDPPASGALEHAIDQTGPLAQRIKASPHLAAATEARARVNDWLGGIADRTAGKKLTQLLAAHPMLDGLVMGLAEGSRYLWELARADPGRLVWLLEAEPERRFEEILIDTKRDIATARDEAEVMRLLRHMKATGALLIALADIGGIWPVMQVIERQTRLADAAVGSAVDYLLADAQRRGRLKVSDPERPAAGSGYIVLAMGKMGAGELNYSSDIDLIVFYDAATPLQATEPAPFYVRITRALVKLLQERTADGYVFRTDLRLRPDPASTQIAISTASALDYYESRGQNWERAALIKARPCAGDLRAGEALLGEFSPFIWRKYLDFAAVADVHDMKRQIHAYRGHDQIAVEGHNIKLGRGGIREIEFFAQTQQLIAGGRHPTLRTSGTEQTLLALVDAGRIERRVADELIQAYRYLRKVEHRVQMKEDRQTHSLPADDAGIAALALFMGYDGPEPFRTDLLATMNLVEDHYAALFEEAPPLAGTAGNLVF